jgi:hypothetical protein
MKISSISGLAYRVRDLDKTVDFRSTTSMIYYGALLATGFTPSTEPRRQRSGAREFLIKDPDGNALAFFAK